MQDWLLAHAPELPCRNIAKMLVVAQGFAVRGLALRPEVPAAGLAAVQGINTHQLGQLEEVRDPAGLLQRLVELLPLPQYAHRMPELVANLRDFGQRSGQAGFTALHPALIPHQLAQLAVEGVDRALTLDRQQPRNLLGDPLLCLSKGCMSGVSLIGIP